MIETLAETPAAGVGVNVSVIVGVSAFVLNTITVVIGATFGFSKLKESTALLSQSGDHLRGAIDDLKTVISHIGEKQTDHGERIAKLEARSKS